MRLVQSTLLATDYSVTLPKPTEQLKAFMQDFRAEASQHPFARHLWIRDGIGFEISIFDGRIHLGAIMSFEEKNAGHASEALKWLCDLADKHQVEMDLTVAPIKNAGAREGKSLNAAQLRQWYKRYGFVAKPSFEGRPMKDHLVRPPRKATASSIVLAARQELWHGGYFHSGRVKRVLYACADKDMAASYVDMAESRFGMSGHPDYPYAGSTPKLYLLSVDLHSRAPDDLIDELERRFDIENTEQGYTPASVFDANLHSAGQVADLVAALKAKGHDHAKLIDIGFGVRVEGPATIIFDGVQVSVIRSEPIPSDLQEGERTNRQGPA